MAKKPVDTGKKRTREHVIADFSLVHVQYFIVNAGFTSEAITKDYGYDLTVNTFDKGGRIEAGSILIQLKASETLRFDPTTNSYLFNLDIRDYNLWINEPNPVFLILYEARSRRAYWLYVQQYLKATQAPKPRANANTVRVRVSMDNKVRTSLFKHARNLKNDILSKIGVLNLHV